MKRKAARKKAMVNCQAVVMSAPEETPVLAGSNEMSALPHLLRRRSPVERYVLRWEQRLKKRNQHPQCLARAALLYKTSIQQFVSNYLLFVKFLRANSTPSCDYSYRAHQLRKSGVIPEITWLMADFGE